MFSTILSHALSTGKVLCASNHPPTLFCPKRQGCCLPDCKPGTMTSALTKTGKRLVLSFTKCVPHPSLFDSVQFACMRVNMIGSAPGTWNTCFGWWLLFGVHHSKSQWNAWTAEVKHLDFHSEQNVDILKSHWLSAVVPILSSHLFEQVVYTAANVQ